MIRQPIVAIMGHVDHGKTLLLDSIRGTAVQAKEAGGITQAIGASIIPLDVIKKVCGDLLKGQTVTIPGLLFIDTPGHAAFTNLRKRGGNLADMAILVIDINDGVMPQTKESIEILKQYKTPFIIAANKIDVLEGWQTKKGKILKTISEQSPEVQRMLDTKLYELVGQIYDLDLQADRFDRVSDFTKQAAIVPVSAKTGEGIPELLMLLTGLAQKYLEQNLKTDVKGPAKGTILEVKEQKGLGTVMDVIIYDGTLKASDTIIIGTLQEPITAKVKALLEPEALAEMRESRSKFKPVKQATASTGVRIVAPGTEEAIAGMPLLKVDNNEAELKEQLKSEVEQITATDPEGVMVKADSLGSLEALITLLREHGVQIRKASIGPITKKDISDVETTKDPLQRAILGFNIPKPQADVKIITSDVIYRLIEEYDKWEEAEQQKIELKNLAQLTRPCKIQLLKGYVFRQSNPAIAGVEVLAGTLKANTPLMKNGKELTRTKGIQLEQENVDQAEKGKKVAVSMPNIIIGRQVQEGDVLYSMITEDEFRKYKEYKQHLSEEEKGLLREIAEIMRADNPVWGV
ncbi:translation initiation factor IF-2 [Candidatus Woesearchaeota archaeon]|nr:translation initiation factor IF-2 [Candidatus Woesearchaeota archaeon]